MASKYASVRVISGTAKYKGTAAIKAKPSHSITASVQPSRGLSSRWYLAVNTHTTNAMNMVTMEMLAKYMAKPSPKIHEIKAGNISKAANNTPSLAKMCTMGRSLYIKVLPSIKRIQISPQWFFPSLAHSGFGPQRKSHGHLLVKSNRVGAPSPIRHRAPRPQNNSCWAA